jgi:hypothetical protein
MARDAKISLQPDQTLAEIRTYLNKFLVRRTRIGPGYIAITAKYLAGYVDESSRALILI